MLADMEPEGEGALREKHAKEVGKERDAAFAQAKSEHERVLARRAVPYAVLHPFLCAAQSLTKIRCCYPCRSFLCKPRCLSH